MIRKKFTVISTIMAIAFSSSCIMTTYSAQAEEQSQITVKDGEWSDVFFNEEYKDDSMYTVKNEPVSTNLALLSHKAGCGLVFPENWRDYSLGLYSSSSDNYMDFYVLQQDDLAKLDEIVKAMNEKTASYSDWETAYSSAYEAAFHLCGIYSRTAAEQDDSALFSDSSFDTSFSCAERIGTFGEREYYFAYNELPPEEGFTDEEMNAIQNMLDSMDVVRENVILFPSHIVSFEETDKLLQEDMARADLSSFETVDLNGNTVTQDIFKDYDITMINIWTTWCQPCRNELPEIQAAYEQLPENANIISFCIDAAEESELAHAIVEKSGLTYTVLEANDELAESLFSFVTAYPTTIFVDSEGHPAAQAVIGVPQNGDVAQAYLTYINDALAK